MAAPQIRLRTLLKEDERYRRWFLKEPKIEVFHTTSPWRILIQKEQGGPWQRGDLPTYAKAFAGVKSRLAACWDMTIHCKPQGFRPPKIKVDGKVYFISMPEDHGWCIYCRRPVIFDYFSKHHNLTAVNYEEKRCSICGAREEPMPKYPSPLSWPAQ